jgi:hypothetical protein
MKPKRVRRVFLRIGQPILCGWCGEPRCFGYGPCRHCGHQPRPELVRRIRAKGVLIDSNGKVVVKS